MFVEFLVKATEPSGLPVSSCMVCFVYVLCLSYYPEPFYLNWRLQESSLTERNNTWRIITMLTGLLNKCTIDGVKNVTHSLFTCYYICVINIYSMWQIQPQWLLLYCVVCQLEVTNSPCLGCHQVAHIRPACLMFYTFYTWLFSAWLLWNPDWSLL